MTLGQVTIFGAGLIGGSIAMGARSRGLARRLIAIDTQLGPTEDTPFDRWVLAADSAAVETAVRDSELTFLCVPVRSIISILPQVLSATKGVVTDCGSTKAAIEQSLLQAKGRPRFVAGHPMAGSPQGGLKNARADLFVGRKWILCEQGSEPSARQRVRDFVAALGAEIVELTASEHDRAVAITSHVPQVVASVIAVQAEDAHALPTAGPGFDSATRVAGGAEAMWRDIFETNGPAVGDALIEVGDRLKALGEELRRKELNETLRTLEKARKARES